MTSELEAVPSKYLLRPAQQQILSVAILEQGLVGFVRMYRQNRCRELWDLPVAYNNSQTVVIWDVIFLGAEEQLGYPCTWPCCMQGSAS